MPPDRCHLHRPGNFGIVSSCTYWQAVSRLSKLSFSPPGFVSPRRGDLCRDAETCQVSGMPVARHPLPSPANVYRGQSPRFPRPDFHRFKQGGSLTEKSKESLSVSPSFVRSRNGYRIESGDYSIAAYWTTKPASDEGITPRSLRRTGQATLMASSSTGRCVDRWLTLSPLGGW